MEIKYYHIDAFTNSVFSGNSAGVCILEDKWLPDHTMQKIAFENNLPETAFIIFKNDQYHIRWFTPAVEVDLCGHATLAAGHTYFNHLGFMKNQISFESRSGILHVKRQNNFCILDFPVDEIVPVEISAEMKRCFNILPKKVLKGKTDFLFIYENENDILNMEFSLADIAKLNCRGVIITAPGGSGVDFVSRFFAPQSGINEDPVTGSAHTTLTPYWSSVLNKYDFTAKQLSPRGGSLTCRLEGERVLIGGESVTYKMATIYI